MQGVKVGLHTLHEEARERFVVDVYQHVFGGVGEGPVAHVMQQYSQARAEGLFIGDGYPFEAERFEGAVH